MPTANMGTPDRIIRIVMGLALVLWFFFDPGTGVLHWLKLIVGVILVGTAAVNFCPLYRLLGISTLR